VLQCAAVCCSVLQCVAGCGSVLQCVAVCCSVLQHAAVHCSVLHCVAVSCSVLQCIFNQLLHNRDIPDIKYVLYECHPSRNVICGVICNIHVMYVI